jgi:ATP-binding cassette subfamily B protein
MNPMKRGQKRVLYRLLDYIKPFRIQLCFVFLMAVLSTLLHVISPKLLGNITTIIFKGSTEGKMDFDAITRILMILGILYCLSSCFAYLQEWITVKVAQKVVRVLRQTIHRKLERLPLSYFDSKQHGEIMSRMTNDAETIGNSLQQIMIQFVTSAITIIGVTAMMIVISPLLTAVTSLMVPLSFWATRRVVSRKYFVENLNTLGALNGHIEEMYTGLSVVKSFNQEEKSLTQFERLNKSLYNSGWKAQFLSGLIAPIVAIVGNISYVLTSVLGAILIIYQRVVIGDVQAILHYTGQFMDPLRQIASMSNLIQSTLAAAERIFEFLDEPEEIPDADHLKSIQDPQGQVVFQQVHFRYKKDTPLIEGLNLHIDPGQTVAIVGPTGAGKTTLVNLLLRFYEIDSGSITIDGKDIRDFKRSQLRQLFGVVLQEPWLFTGTIRDNIAYARENATEKQIVQASKAAYADPFIRTLPHGYDTVLEEGTSIVSQGQKQLLTIARAFLADPMVLILDEAMSSVDTRTEVQIQKACKN